MIDIYLSYFFLIPFLIGMGIGCAYLTIGFLSNTLDWIEGIINVVIWRLRKDTWK